MCPHSKNYTQGLFRGCGWGNTMFPSDVGWPYLASQYYTDLSNLGDCFLLLRLCSDTYLSHILTSWYYIKHYQDACLTATELGFITTMRWTRQYTWQLDITTCELFYNKKFSFSPSPSPPNGQKRWVPRLQLWTLQAGFHLISKHIRKSPLPQGKRAVSVRFRCPSLGPGCQHPGTFASSMVYLSPGSPALALDVHHI